MTQPFPNDSSSAASQAARLLFVNPDIPEDYDPDDVAPITGITLRIPSTVVARLQVLATNAGVSRNTMAQLILKAGFESVFALLPEDKVESLREEILEAYQSNL